MANWFYTRFFSHREFLLEQRRPLCHRTIFAVLISITFECCFQFDATRTIYFGTPAYPFHALDFFMKRSQSQACDSKEMLSLKLNTGKWFLRRVYSTFQFVRRFRRNGTHYYHRQFPIQRVSLSKGYTQRHEFSVNSETAKVSSVRPNTFGIRKFFFFLFCNLWAPRPFVEYRRCMYTRTITVVITIIAIIEINSLVSYIASMPHPFRLPQRNNE